MNSLFCICLAFFSAPSLAFVPKSLIFPAKATSLLSTRRIAALPMIDAVDTSTTTAANAAEAFSFSSSICMSDAMDALTNFALIIGLLVILGVGFLALFSTVIIPQAAQQLQEQAQRDYPDLWEEIAVEKLKPGEQLVQRPDIMQDLGTAVRQRLESDMEKAVAEQKQKTRDAPFVDAEVVKDEDEKK